MNKKFAHIAEIIWLLITLFALITGIFETYKKGISMSYPFFIITFIAAFMYIFRRTMRKKQLPK